MRIMVLSILLCACASAVAHPVCTDTAKVTLLEKIVAIQAEFRQLKSTQDFLMQDSMQYTPSNYSEYQSLAVPSAWGVAGIDSNLRRLGIIAYTMERIPAGPKGNIALSSEPTFYCLATAKSGAIFLLRGFWRNDFASMVRQEIGDHIDSALSIALGLFYVEHVVYPLGMWVIDTSASRSTLLNLKVQVHYPMARVDTEGDFHVSIYDIQPKSDGSRLIGESVERRFIFGKNGSFKCLVPRILGTFNGSPQRGK